MTRTEKSIETGSRERLLAVEKERKGDVTVTLRGYRVSFYGDKNDLELVPIVAYFMNILTPLNYKRQNS